MPTREYTEKERKEAEQAGEMLKKECGHSRLTGECLEYNEMCYFEDQEKCPEYVPKDEVKNKKS